LVRHIEEDNIVIASIGVEYDGYPGHYVESKVKSTYERDIGIVAEKGIFSIRLSPELWKRDPELVKKAIKKYFERKIHEVELIQKSTIRAIKRRTHCSRPISDQAPINLKSKRFFDCPICNGNGSLANDYCPVCKGVGALYEDQLKNTEWSKYMDMSFDCPDCNKRSTCRTCLGAGFISRDKAIKWQETHA
jgi:hypothetical protein